MACDKANLGGCESISLAGTWQVALDRSSAGLDHISADDQGALWLPGSLQAQGYGDQPTAGGPWTCELRSFSWADEAYAPFSGDEDYKMPFWLQPDRMYVGQAWYQKEIVIPQAWDGQKISLYLERVHWTSEVFLDDRLLGQQDSLCTPHIYDLTGVKPGRYTLKIGVHNGLKYPVGINAHSVSDHTQGNWNGVVGRIELQAEPLVHIKQLRVDPDFDRKTVRVRAQITNLTPGKLSGDLKAVVELNGESILRYNQQVDVESHHKTQKDVLQSGATYAFDLALGDQAQAWDEFDPTVYRLSLSLETELGVSQKQTSFGFRKLTTQGTQFLINGRPMMFRGTLDSAIYPLTGFPPMTEAMWEKVFTQVQAFGLNHVRFHSWCPPHAAFDVADRMGVYIQAEGPFWLNQGSTVGEGEPIDDYVYQECDRILDEYGHHPSFVLMTHGNEPSGPDENGEHGMAEQFLGQWLEYIKKRDTGRLYTSGAGWPRIQQNDFHNHSDPRIQQWGEGLTSILNGQPPQTTSDHRNKIVRDIPTIAHEIGQWCAYPDFSEMAKYTGWLKPKNFELFQHVLKDNGLEHLQRDFLMASGALQVLCYKADIEMALRTPKFGGFHLLDLHDFPGQGTALVGVLDPFWDPKPYINQKQYAAFCGPTIPLARMDGRTFESGEILKAQIEISHFGPQDLSACEVKWSLTVTGQNLGDDDNQILAQGAWMTDLPTGQLSHVGDLEISLDISVATKAVLKVEIEDLDVANDWDFWLYPNSSEYQSEQLDSDSGYVTQALDEQTQQRLENGENVLWLVDRKRVKGGVAMGFSAPFWNYAWTDEQAPHTLGILVDPEHPVFNDFPTEYHSNWQWWDLVHDAGAMLLSDLPTNLDPLVRPIDTWYRGRPLGCLFEVKVGMGKLMVCSMDLMSDLDERLAARQFRCSLIGYMNSDAFMPEVQIELHDLHHLVRESTWAEKLGIRVTASSANGGYEPEKAIDGDPSTMWQTDFSGNVMMSHPHHLTLSFPEPMTLDGLGYTARQGSVHGQIGQYAIHISDDGENWGLPIATGCFTGDAQEQLVMFDQSVSAEHIRLVALDSLNGQSHSAISGLRLLMPDS